MIRKFELFLEHYNLWDRTFNPPKDEFGRKLKFTKNKIMKKPMYRTMTMADWQHALKTGKFLKSLPTDNEDYLRRIKDTDPKTYKEIRYREKSRDYTRVTPYPDYAKMHVWTNPNDVFVEFKPIYKKLQPSSEVGGYDEIFAEDLSIEDVKKVIDMQGNILYEN